MQLNHIQSFSRRELICLNLSLCSAATIWIPGREEFSSSAVIFAAWKAAGSIWGPHTEAENQAAQKAGGRRERWRGHWIKYVVGVEFLAMLVSLSASLWEIRQIRRIARTERRSSWAQRRMVKPVVRLPRVCLLFLSFFFFYLRTQMPIGEFGWRSSTDRRDEAEQAMLVSFQEHHPSSWELSAWNPLQGGGHRSPQRGSTRTSDGSRFMGESSLSVVRRTCSVLVQPFTAVH